MGDSIIRRLRRGAWRVGRPRSFPNVDAGGFARTRSEHGNGLVTRSTAHAIAAFLSVAGFLSVGDVSNARAAAHLARTGKITLCERASDHLLEIAAPARTRVPTGIRRTPPAVTGR